MRKLSHLYAMLFRREIILIEQILIGSCEHQRYRRAAQLAMLEYFRYPVEITDVVWGWHADYHDASVYQDSLRNMGVDYFSVRTSSIIRYSQSNTELKMRMLTQIVETGKNTIMVEDDHFLIMSKSKLNEKLRNLKRKAGTSVEVVQLFPRARVINQPILPIPEAEDFEHGCYGRGHHMLFVTPAGAEKLLEFMRDPNTLLSIENGMAKYLYDESWIYSVVPTQKQHFVKSLKCIQGDSIGTLLTQSGESIRRTDEQIEREFRVIEHFKL